MAVSIQTTEGPVTISDGEITGFEAAFPGIDVNAEFQALAARVARDGNPPSVSNLTRALNGWLRKARPQRAQADPATPRAAMSPAVQNVFDLFRGEGLISRDFQPNGEDDDAKISSIRAKATCNYYRRNPNTLEPDPEAITKFGGAMRLHLAETIGEQLAVMFDTFEQHKDEYVYRCDRCGEMYDQTVQHEQRKLCLWCAHQVTGLPIPHFRATLQAQLSLT